MNDGRDEEKEGVRMMVSPTRNIGNYRKIYG
jgi:hypothetical protein